MDNNLFLYHYLIYKSNVNLGLVVFLFWHETAAEHRALMLFKS